MLKLNLVESGSIGDMRLEELKPWTLKLCFHRVLDINILIMKLITLMKYKGKKSATEYSRPAPFDERYNQLLLILQNWYDY